MKKTICLRKERFFGNYDETYFTFNKNGTITIVRYSNCRDGGTTPSIDFKDAIKSRDEFGYIIGFHEGLSAFIGDNHLYGFIDKSGNQVIPPIWDFCSGFKNGLAPVRKFRKKVWLYRQTRKCGYSLSVGWC